MKDQSREPSRARLEKEWCRWTSTVELFANHRPGRRRGGHEAYRTMHRELIAACRSMASEADAEGRIYYEKLEDLVAPWLSLNTLERAETEILADLLARCRRVDRELGGRGGRPRVLTRVAKVALGAAVLGGGLALTPTLGVDMRPLVDRLRDWTDSIWIVVRFSTASERIGVAVAVVVVVSIWVNSRVSRA
jgi:hypothetical protein